MASIYAKILVDQTRQNDSLFLEITNFNTTLTTDFLTFLKNSKITLHVKIDFIKQLKLDQRLQDVIKIALSNKDIQAIKNLAHDYESHLQVMLNLKVIEIEFASPIEQNSQKQILEKLAKDFLINEFIVKSSTINPDLITGFHIKSLNDEYDYSMRGELERKKRSLIKEYYV